MRRRCIAFARIIISGLIILACFVALNRHLVMMLTTVGGATALLLFIVVAGFLIGVIRMEDHRTGS